MIASGRCLRGQVKRLLGRRGHGDAMALRGQRALQRPADGLFIIDDQDVFQGAGRLYGVEVAGIGLIGS